MSRRCRGPLPQIHNLHETQRSTLNPCDSNFERISYNPMRNQRKGNDPQGRQLLLDHNRGTKAVSAVSALLTIRDRASCRHLPNNDIDHKQATILNSRFPEVSYKRAVGSCTLTSLMRHVTTRFTRHETILFSACYRPRPQHIFFFLGTILHLKTAACSIENRRSCCNQQSTYKH